MLFIDEAGEGIELHGEGETNPLPDLTGLDDEQVRGFFARFLVGSGLPRDRVARILRIDRTGIEASLRVPLPFDPISILSGNVDEVGPDPVSAPKGRVTRSRRS